MNQSPLNSAEERRDFTLSLMMLVTPWNQLPECVRQAMLDNNDELAFALYKTAKYAEG